MKLKVIKGEEDDTFTKSENYAFKDDEIYEIWNSEKSYCAGNCIGKMRVVVKNNEVKGWIYPMMSGGYDILTPELISKYRKILEAMDNINTN